MHYSGFILSAAVLTSLFYTGWQNFKTVSMDVVPIRYVRIEGVFQYLEKDDIKKLLQPLVTTDFFSADVQAMQRSALSLPWVAAVKVKRIWPDAIDIKIFERKPAVRWGGKSLLNQHGEIFSPENIDAFKALPLLIGPKGQESELFEIMQSLSLALKENALKLSTFEVSERRSWKITLMNGMEMQLGRTEPLKKFKVFLQTLPVLGKDNLRAISRVDLRYPNGFAVRWKKGESPQWESKNDTKQNV